MRSRLIAVLTICSNFYAGVALADAVPPPPENCPPGSRGTTGHAGPACVVADCTSDAECKQGEQCRQQALCTEQQEYTIRRRREPKYQRTVARGECDEGASACTPPAQCSVAKRCVKGPPQSAPSGSPGTTGPSSGPAPGRSDSPPAGPTGSSCSRCTHTLADPGSSQGWAVVALLGAVLGLAGRRRRHESHCSSQSTSTQLRMAPFLEGLAPESSNGVELSTGCHHTRRRAQAWSTP